MCTLHYLFTHMYTDPLELTHTHTHTQLLHPTPLHPHPTHVATDLKLIAHHLGVLAEIRKRKKRSMIYLPGSSGESNEAMSHVS